MPEGLEGRIGPLGVCIQHPTCNEDLDVGGVEAAWAHTHHWAGCPEDLLELAEVELRDLRRLALVVRALVVFVHHLSSHAF